MPDLDRPPVTRRRPRDQAAAAITAALALALGVAYVVAQRDSSSGGADASSVRTELGPCAGGDLVAGDDSMRLDAGTAYLTTTLELAPGAEPCTVDGHPTVIVLSGGRASGVGTVRDDSLGEASRITVLPDRSARVTLGWPVFHYCGPTVNDSIRLWIAPDLSVDVSGFGPASCTPGEGRPPVRVGAFTYVDPTAEEGTVSGVVTLNSGPGPGTGEFVTSGVVELEGDPDGFQAPIGPDGSFEIEVPAQRYRVTVTTHQYYGGRDFEAGSVEVAGGELNELNITLPLR